MSTRKPIMVRDHKAYKELVDRIHEFLDTFSSIGYFVNMEPEANREEVKNIIGEEVFGILDYAADEASKVARLVYNLSKECAAPHCEVPDCYGVVVTSEEGRPYGPEADYDRYCIKHLLKCKYDWCQNRVEYLGEACYDDLVVKCSGADDCKKFPTNTGYCLTHQPEPSSDVVVEYDDDDDPCTCEDGFGSCKDPNCDCEMHEWND